MSDDRRVVIIGSGPSGAMAAFELVRKGIPVTVLETGGDIQRGTLDWTVWAMGIAVGLLAVALLAINNLRDARNDVLSGKHTMAVRFGETFARIEID